ncbi:MAG: translation initiation factor IF-2, partial [Bacteroidales bacterium]|nr:translation initiation factor IF-2 [Bacteroidales bacterium]
MPEGKKSIRLKQAATEFNVGIATIIEFLNKKGKKIESNPNTKLDSEIFELLSAEFQSERQKKDKADRLQISISKKTEQKEIVAQEKHPKLSSSGVSEENSGDIIIKSNTIDFKKQKQAKQSASAKTETPLDTEKQPSDTAVNTDKSPVINSENSEVIKLGEQQINILGKIDLDSLNTKTKPDKKAKEKKEDKSSADKKKESSKKKEKETSKKKDKKEKTKQPQKAESKKTSENEQKEIAETVSEEKITETTPAEVVKTEEKKDNFIQTTYVKLSGPKLTGEKVDLSVFESSDKKKENSKDAGVKADTETRKKRKRIKTASATPINKESKPQVAVKDTAKKDSLKKKEKKRDKRKKVEIDSTEIEKQIKETLARLSPMGKSKTSKHRREKRQEIAEHHQQELLAEQEQKNILKVTEFVTANELATMMNVPVTKIIASCMQLGMFVSINQRLDAEALQLIADEFGYKIEFVSAEVVNALETEEEAEEETDLVPRSPIVTVMGHVDHGKTSLLDYIRKTNVIAGEAGGITQHIGAYEVSLQDGKKITFLDTPGHEAFTAMRARGAKMTDIAIIVVACDDKIMPQTVEAINHAQAAGVPIIFALNKIDKPGADPERIKGELANMNLLVEDWGGKIQSQEISAKQGINVDMLLEKVLLEAEMLDLKGNPNKRAKGTVIESSLDKGRGYVAKILVQDGTIKQGDFVLAGATYGRVKAMYNERNQLMKTAGPSAPVLLLGLNGAPQAGDTFNVVHNEKDAKDLANKRLQLQREQGLRTQK